MSNKKDYVFTVETKEAGQRRAYGDSYYHYVVSTKLPMNELKGFCTNVLMPAIPEDQYKAELNDDFGNVFQHYYTELKVINEVRLLEDGLNIVEYKATRPSTE